MTLQNPYPKDIFKWDNKEKLDFNRGRFNQHCFETFENCREDIIKLIDESTEWYKVKIKSMGIGEARRFCVEFKKHLYELKEKCINSKEVVK